MEDIRYVTTKYRVFPESNFSKITQDNAYFQRLDYSIYNHPPISSDRRQRNCSSYCPRQSMCLLPSQTLTCKVLNSVFCLH